MVNQSCLMVRGGKEKPEQFIDTVIGAIHVRQQEEICRLIQLFVINRRFYQATGNLFIRKAVGSWYFVNCFW